MKTIVLFTVLVLMVRCDDGGSLDERFMRVGKYVVEHCRQTQAYDSLPARYTRALEMGRDSAERLVRGLERDIKLGVCPE